MIDRTYEELAVQAAASAAADELFEVTQAEYETILASYVGSFTQQAPKVFCGATLLVKPARFRLQGSDDG